MPTMSVRSRSAAQIPNRLLAALPPYDLELLIPRLRDVQLHQGAVLHGSDDLLQDVVFPLSGMISITAVMKNGEAVETATIGREGAFGLLAGLGVRNAFGRATVQMPGAALRISVPHWSSAIEQSSAIRRIALTYTGFLMACFQQAAACNALHSLEARLCGCLLQAHDRADGDKLPLKQEFIAQMLGVRRTSVTFVAGLLQQADVIRVRRGVIEVIDRNELEARSCECHATFRAKLKMTFT